MAIKKFGVDISLYQRGFDFERAKNEGVEFVIIKSSESNFVDPQFETHYAAAKKAGLYVGAYHYLRSTTKDGVINEAKSAMKALSGKQFEYPIFVDVEEPCLRIGKAQLTELVKTFCDTLEAAGFWCGFYTNLDWYRNALDGEALAKRYSFWLATWAKTQPNLPNIQLWQFGGSTNLIRSNQISGMVCDQDYCFVDFPALIKSRGKNGYKAEKTATTQQTFAGASSNTNTQKPATQPSTSSKPTSSAKPTTKPTTAKFVVGDKVKISSNAVVYGTNNKFSSFVYNSILYVRDVDKSGDRIVISVNKTGDITGAVAAKYLSKVSGNTSNTTQTATQVSTALARGNKIKIDPTAVAYGTSNKFAPWVYNTVYKIVGITEGGKRIAFATVDNGVVVGAVDKKYVKKV